MNPILRNTLAIIAGIVAGSMVNMSIVTISGSIIPPPEGADLTTPEGVKAAMPLMQPIHFLFPFLAHAVGTLVGAYIAARMSAVKKMRSAYIIGFFFLTGGIAASMMIPAPMWFIIVDLVVAYLPMAHLACKFATRNEA